MRRSTTTALALVLLVAAGVVGAQPFSNPILDLLREGPNPTWKQYALPADTGDWYRLETGDTFRIVPADSTPGWFARFKEPTSRRYAQQWTEYWMFAVADSWGATPTIDFDLRYRYVNWNPKFPDIRILGPWLSITTAIIVPDSLYILPLWGGDTLGWFSDLEFQVLDGGTLDSAQIRLWLGRRGRR